MHVVEFVNNNYPATMWWSGLALAGLTIAVAVRRLLQKREDLNLENKVVWITGASSGIGEALAIEFAKSKAKLVLSARSKDKLEHVASLCVAASSASENVSVLVLDLTAGTAELQRKCTEAKQIYKTVDILVNCAGISMREDALSTSLETDRRIMEVNFMSPVVLTKSILPDMINKKRGYIININSVQGKLGLPFRTTYSASKHALTGYMDGLRGELDCKGIRVLNVFPGYVRTNLSINAVRGDGSKHGELDENTAKGMSPTVLAVRVLQALADGKQEIVESDISAKVGILIRTLMPAVFFSMMAKRGKRNQ
eukprot:m.65697 g.65697  ORF g.65697 m.65697 type:complete len:312 (-) comp11752_c0_seq4:134-1069(-)